MATGVAADAAAVDDGVDEDIDRGVSIVGLVFFAVLDHPAHRTIEQHREALEIPSRSSSTI